MAYESSDLIGVDLDKVYTTQDFAIGTVCKGKDATLGEGEFIFLKGVASLAVGDMVVYDDATGAVTRAVAASRGPIGVAMAAAVAGNYCWFQIRGVAVIKSAGAVAVDAVLYLTATAGAIDDAVTAGSGISGAVCVTATGAADLNGRFALMYPSADGAV